MSRTRLLIYVGFLGWLLFMWMEFYQAGHVPNPSSIMVVALLGLILVTVIVVPAIIGIRRQERLISEGKLQASAVVSVPSRVKVYVFIVTITLVSVTVQTLRILPRINTGINHRAPILFWNFAAMIGVIVVMEIGYRLKNRH